MPDYEEKDWSSGDVFRAEDATEMSREIEEQENTKLDRNDVDANWVYVTEGAGVQSTKQYSSTSITSGTFMYRGTGGRSVVGTPDGTDGNQVVNVTYLGTAALLKPKTGTVATAAATAAKTVTLDAPNASYVPVAGDLLLLTFTLGNSASAPTLAVNAETAKPISSPSGTSSGHVTIAATMKAFVYYDGTTYWTLGVLANTTYSTVSTTEIDTGTSNSQRVVTPAIVAYIMRAQRIGSGQTSGTATADASLHNQYNLRGLTVNVTIAAPTGTPVDGQQLVYCIEDNGTQRTLTWNAIFRSFTGATLPATTTINKTMYVFFRYNTGDTKWDCFDVKIEA